MSTKCDKDRQAPQLITSPSAPSTVYIMCCEKNMVSKEWCVFVLICYLGPHVRIQLTFPAVICHGAAPRRNDAALPFLAMTFARTRRRRCSTAQRPVTTVIVGRIISRPHHTSSGARVSIPQRDVALASRNSLRRRYFYCCCCRCSYRC
ncbi:unnamed protein product [Heligmosomoides polygyrus]|uniref:Uncharacterized protein n=1 Tax=Heligmosomoides polygyrus TaxID=6339 RepID=A0A183FGG8_HELPZ|nr:unnamed protein product [Heligmosomoides polygyrus]